MPIVVNKKTCCGCQACFNVCPKNCISMIEDDEGFCYPKVDYSACINCNLCEKVCQFLVNDQVRSSEPFALAAKTKNDSLRNDSSSGGVFGELAAFVLKKGGVVYGVSMLEDNRSAHFSRIDNINDLRSLLKSKYLQASIGDTFKTVKSDLLVGKLVLFSGVGCQIDALKLFLGTDYEKLITVDVICHGVPSPKLWSGYIDYLENKYRAKLSSVDFRHKNNATLKIGVSRGNNRIVQYCTPDRDQFMVMFLKNLSLRPSCYNCRAKKLDSMSDITLGDFWGVDSVLPKANDGKGLSLVLVHTDKGKKIMESFDGILEEIVISAADGVKRNPSYSVSSPMPKERDGFFSDFKHLGFEKTAKKYSRKPMISKIKTLIRSSILRKLVKLFNRNDKRGSDLVYGLLLVFKK